MSTSNRSLQALKISGLVAGFIGLSLLTLAFFKQTFLSPTFGLSASLLLMGMGVAVYAIGHYAPKTEGIKNDGNWQNSLTNRGWWGLLLGIVITGFYVLLYWFPGHLGLGQEGASNFGLVAFFDPLSQFFKGEPASQWFVYGTLYTPSHYCVRH